MGLWVGMLVDALDPAKTGEHTVITLRTSPKVGFVDTSVLLGVMLSHMP